MRDETGSQDPSADHGADHNRLAKHFDEAARLKGDARSEYLAKIEADEPALHAELIALLSEDARTTGPLDVTTMEGVPAVGRSDEALPIQQIGPYRILSILGQGGMGRVYEAEQERPKRIVALKVLAPTQNIRQLERRLTREAEILGRLQHPGIAQVYEAGSADSGYGPQPYLAMERIEGVPLGEYVARRNPNREERLGIFLQIAEAVDYAHDRGVIHRDLKPDNVLVEPTGRARVLDFGIARLADPDVAMVSLHTEGHVIGTLAYMSPEQAQGQASSLDLRSDVYSLGVVLYEMLTGQPPYTVIGMALPQAIEVICQHDPTAPSTHERTLRGDLDTICMKAIEKDRQRRYSTVAEFAEDIRRFLASEPISARPTTIAYRALRYMKRNRALLAVIAALVVGAVIAGREAYQASIARDDARQEAKIAKEARAREAAQALETDTILQLFLRTLSEANPWNEPGKKPTIQEAVIRVAEEIDSESDLSPATEARARAMIGDLLQVLGNWETALPHLQRAWELTQVLPDKTEVDRNDAGIALASVLLDTGGVDQAVGLLQTAEDFYRSQPGTLAKQQLGHLLRLQAGLKSQAAHYEEAEACATEAIQTLESVGDGGKSEWIYSGEELAEALLGQERVDDAHAVARRFLDSATENQRGHAGFTAHLKTIIGICLARLGEYEESEKILRETLMECELAVGTDHALTYGARQELTFVFMQTGRVSQAIQENQILVEVSRRTRGPNHSTTVTSLHNLGYTYRRTGRYQDALDTATEAYTGSLAAVGREHPMTGKTRSGMGESLRGLKRTEEARDAFREAFEILRDTAGLDSIFTQDSLNGLIDTSLILGNLEDVETYRALQVQESPN